MKFICPLILVQDIAKSRYFYEVVLGQVVKYDFGEDVTFHGDFTIHLEEHFKKLISQDFDIEIKKRSNNFELYFECENLTEIVNRLKDEGVKFLHEIREQPWGQRVMRFYDYDDHIVEIGESMESVVTRYYKEGYSPEKISKRTGLSIDFVIGALNEKNF